ncbi:MAG: type II toxin-antitoxin system PemK/MazF family toxin, partial [Microbacteriaceae bacterium]|nr:type II toxin-antitoxin system PemK/MazF family toxin [Microbacteriaceae bacterium]
MARLVVGDVVVVPFPVSHGMAVKRRPAFVVAIAEYGRFEDYQLCVISATNTASDPLSVPYELVDFSEGSLGRPGYVQVRYLFTMDGNQINRKIARFS